MLVLTVAMVNEGTRVLRSGARLLLSLFSSLSPTVLFGFLKHLQQQTQPTDP